MLGIISRRTIIWFLLFVASWSFFAYRSWQFGKPCREWKRSHPQASTAQHESDGSDTIEISPCNLWY